MQNTFRSPRGTFWFLALVSLLAFLTGGCGSSSLQRVYQLDTAYTSALQAVPPLYDAGAVTDQQVLEVDAIVKAVSPALDLLEQKAVAGENVTFGDALTTASNNVDKLLALLFTFKQQAKSASPVNPRPNNGANTRPAAIQRIHRQTMPA